jgi:transposase
MKTDPSQEKEGKQMDAKKHNLHAMHGGEEAVLPKTRQEEILMRHREGNGIKQIARELELSRNTVRQVVRKGESRKYERRAEKGRLIAPYEEWIQERFVEVEYNATLLYQELKARGYAGGYTTVREYVKPLREAVKQKATVRFETSPGQQAQLDWGSKTIMIEGRMQRVHIFVMTMGYSRASYAELVWDETLDTLIQCHEHAFEWFGGVPEEILYDNPKTIVLDRGSEQARMNPKFEDFSRYYGYTARLCRPYRAQTKGKVESGVKYVKRSFLAGKSFESIGEGNEILWGWIREEADERIHGTTFEKPSARFADEQLTPLKNRPAYQIKQPTLRKVAVDSMVNLESNRYSVPWQYVGQTLEVRKQGDLIQFYSKDSMIAVHEQANGRHQTQMNPAHYHGLYGHKQPQSGHKQEGAAPAVMVRPLAVYEQLAAGGGQHG